MGAPAPSSVPSNSNRSHNPTVPYAPEGHGVSPAPSTPAAAPGPGDRTERRDAGRGLLNQEALFTQ